LFDGNHGDRPACEWIVKAAGSNFDDGFPDFYSVHSLMFARSRRFSLPYHSNPSLKPVRAKEASPAIIVFAGGAVVQGTLRFSGASKSVF
jgi:hypothetical protein